ncbi:hypothetical protein [Neisseria meningitidis]|uniref:hypothetical protein n=1 Tax=Neisseria meningitidis TaxID=487 RepID=UPI00130246CD|nr:hypothetical protein [Neisseria meningitidis]
MYPTKIFDASIVSEMPLLENEVGYLYPTKIFDASIVSEMPLLENVGFENPTYGYFV